MQNLNSGASHAMACTFHVACKSCAFGLRESLSSMKVVNSTPSSSCVSVSPSLISQVVPGNLGILPTVIGT
jgi:hypothetical protein